MTDAEIHALVGALAPVFKGYVESLFAPLQGRIAVLEARAPAPDQAAILAAVEPELADAMQRLAADLGKSHGTVLAPVIARVDQLEARAPVAGPPGEPGQPGQDAPAPDHAAILALIQNDLRLQFADELARGAGALLQPVIARVDQLEARAPLAGPPGEPGAPGEPGKDAPLPSPETFQAGIAQAVADQLGDVMGGPIQETVRGFIADAITPIIPRLIALEKAEAIPGPPGEPGKPGETPSRPVLQEILSDLLKDYPWPQDGQPGKDGVGVAGAMLNREGHLVVTLSNGEHSDLGLVVGTDGKPGRDGFTLENFSADLAEDGRTVLLKFTRGDDVQVHELQFPVPIDRGVYKPGEYKRGDAVSWGGSMWIAQKDTDQQPEAGTDWRLAVKRGRNGNDGVMKPAKAHTPVKLGDGK